MTGSLFHLLAETTSRTSFEWGRDLSTPVDWLLPLGVFVLLAWFVVGVYLRDCVELGTRFAVLLIGLRLLALAGILAVYLQPQWRTQREVVSNSRAALLVDTSQSMGRRDVPASDSSAGANMESRIERVVRELSEGNLVNELRGVHDVVVYRFDQEDNPAAVASLTKFADASTTEKPSDAELAQRQASIASARRSLGWAAVALAAAVVLLVWYLIRPATTGAKGAGPLVASGLALVVAVGVTIWTWAGTPGLTVRSLLGLESAIAEVSDDPVEPGAGAADEEIDWQEKLVAQGGDTKLGQAVYQLALDEQGTPLSAIVVFSDGQRTAGLEVEEAAKFARDSDLPVHAVGLGSIETPQFVRMVDFTAPARAYRGDPFEITGFIQSHGLAGRSAVVTLRQLGDSESTQQDADDTGLIYEADTTLGADRDDVVPVLFDVEAFESAGRFGFELAVRVKGSQLTESDTQRRFYIDVVDRQTRVLLVSGGPSREYQFLRNLLRRDKYIDLDVLLQSKRQEKIDDPDFLIQFPATRDDLSQYDAVIALDAAWDQVGAAGATMVEQWVSDEAGGLIIVPGNVHAGSIVRSWTEASSFPDLQPLRDLCPVEFLDQFARLNDRQPGTKTAWPIELSRAGMEAEFLRLDDNASESQRRWSEFEGIYGGFAVKAEKYGATVYGRFADSMAEALGYEPIYLAGHFYGKGRVFYVGSGEMWRLRQIDEAHFEQFYTRLIRHVTMGRLHQGSPRGDVLLLEKEQYNVGDSVPVVAHLKNAQREPLDVETVTMFVFDPDEKGTPLLLKQDPARPGTYRGDFVVREAQDYRLELQLPESDDETLSKVIKVSTSAREKKQPQQNDKVLKALADTTGGEYYSSIEAVLGRTEDAPLAPKFEDQTRITPVTGDIDPIWKAAWAKWMMFGICGVLCLEWLLRRLFKLA